MNISLHKKKYILFIVFSSLFTCHFLQAVINFTGTLAGDVTGKQKSTVVSTVGGAGGVSQAQIISGVRAANAATSANTANTIVKRDASKNFSAGTITAALAGNATTATTAATASNVGGVTAANVASGANAANAATSANTASTIVKRDASGNFSAGTITAALSGNATTATTATTASNVGGVTAANVASGANAANAATSSNTASKIVLRDGSGNFSTNVITLNELDLLSTQTLFIDGNVALGENAPLFVDAIEGASGSAVQNITVESIILNELDLLSTDTLFINGNLALVPNATLFVDNIAGSGLAESGSLVDNIFVFNLYAVNNLTPSDKCLKTEITDLDGEHCLTLVNQMVPHEFNYKPEMKKALGDDGERHIGFIAQELAKVDPRFVKFAPGKMLGDLTKEELAFVKQELFVPLLVGALKAEDRKLLDQITQTQQLQARVSALEKFITSMK